MKKRSRMLAGMLAAVLAAGMLTGCGGGGDAEGTTAGAQSETQAAAETAAEAEQAEQVFTYSTGSVVVGLNPIMNTTAPDNLAHNILCEPLVKNVTAENNTTQIIPGAAESWELSEDGKTYTFHLHEGMKWSDGEPFTAHDFEYTLKLMADPDTAAVNAWLFDGIIENFGDALYSNGKTAEDIAVTAVDDVTLEIRLVHPASYFLELVSSLFPVRQDKYEEWGDAYGSSAEKAVYSGPFMVESWSQNTEMVAVKNPYHWDAENIKLDRIVQKVIQESATAIQAFINGELDVIATSDPNWGQMILETGNVTEYAVPNSAPEFLMFNLNNEYLSNTKVRQAISIAFDRQEFVDTLRDGRAVPIYSVMPDTMMVGDKTYTELVGGANYFVKAMQEETPDPKQLLEEGLAELGLPADASQVTIRFASRGTDELSKKIAEWYKQIWETNLGITVEIDMMEWNVMWEKIDAGDYDIAVGGWGPYYNEPSAILSLYDPDNGYFNSSKTGWDDENAALFKELCTKAVDTVDDAEKAQLYLQAEELLVKNAIIAPEYLEESPSYVANYVKNYHVSTNGYVDYTKVFIEK